MKDQDQRHWLEDSSNTIKQNAYRMSRAIEQENFQEVVKHATHILNELRTSLLSPKRYYQLYVQVFDELTYVENFFLEEHQRGRPMQDIYDSVQQCGSIVPRLYLLITAGAVFLRSGEANGTEIMKDLVTMCKGIQHPIRGLFLRHYLNQSTKGKWLTDVGDLQTTIEIIVLNFVEMNKLWVRLQHQSAVIHNKLRAEEERDELKVLVGQNLVRLANLEGLTATVYRDRVLPLITQQVLHCRDVTAQEYLLDTLVQVIPDELHVQSLGYIVYMLSNVLDAVPVASIMVALIERLTAFLLESEEITGPVLNQPLDVSITTVKLGGDFDELDAPAPEAAVPVADINLNDTPAAAFLARLTQMLDTVLEARASATPSDGLLVHLELMKACLAVHPDRLDVVSKSFSRCKAYIEAGATHLLGTVLLETIKGLPTPLLLAEIEDFTAVLGMAPAALRKTIAESASKAMIEAGAPLATVDQVSAAFSLAEPLMSDAEDEDDLDDQVTLVAGVITLINSPDTDVAVQLIDVARRAIQLGDAAHVRRTLQPLLFKTLHIAQRVSEATRAAEKAGDDAPEFTADVLFRLANEIAAALVDLDPTQAFQMQLSCALAADACGPAYDDVVYDFISCAILTAQDTLPTSRARHGALMQVVNALTRLTSISQDNYLTLASSCTQMAGAFLARRDQCRAVAAAAHLFWTDNCRDAGRVLECIKKASVAADKCRASLVSDQLYIPLFVETLDRVLGLYEARCPTIDLPLVRGMLSIVEGGVHSAGDSAKAHYDALVHHISDRAGEEEWANMYTPLVE